MSRTRKACTSVGDYMIAAMLVFLSWVAVMSTGCRKETQPASNSGVRKEAITAFADAQDQLIDTDNPEHQSQKHGFAVRFPQDPQVQTYLAGTAYETLSYEARVEGQGLYKVVVNAVPFPEPILSDRTMAQFLEKFLASKLAAYGDSVKEVKKVQVLLLGRRALAYEYELATGEGTVCFRGFYIVNQRTGYEVGVLSQKGVKDSILQDYRAFVSSFRLLS